MAALICTILHMQNTISLWKWVYVNRRPWKRGHRHHFYCAMLAQSAVMRLHVVRLSVCL